MKVLIACEESQEVCKAFRARGHEAYSCDLIEATCDILVTAGVLADDNSRIVAAHDGSRVDYDKQNPRVEIWIEEMEDKNG